MKKSIVTTSIASVLLLTASGLLAQDNDQVMMKQIEHDNQATIDAISLYPTDTRRDILEAARYPEIVVRLNAMQKQSSGQFSELVAPLGKQDQEEIWNLTRYPSLVSELAYDHPKSNDELGNILQRYPEEIHNAALDQAYRNYALLVQIDQSNAAYQTNLDRLLMAYPRVTANAYRNLVKQPEVLSILYDNMQTTVVLGDIYKNDPQYVLFETDSLYQALTIQNQQAAQDWQTEMQQDPDAQREYQQAAADYAQESGYAPDDYNTAIPAVVTTYPVYPYNWWFGYPTWYTSPCWDPYPYWYDWGFYYGPGHVAVYFGMPSYHFMNWYFY
ncbi:MAG TPA: hypothetical protein VNZ86_20670, partial [Bacteroidia bacterium]|nr:hypothetical protein [Bacteroidia bacterium]